jgi:hypothetical protein
MARLLLPPPFTGTRENICVYKWKEEYYVRAKSTLSSKRVKTAPEFKRSMENAALLAKASKIASEIYRSRKEKNFHQYRLLTGQAIRRLKSGLEEEEVKRKLLEGLDV